MELIDSDLLAGHCRSNALYATQKLSFFDRYFPAAFKVAARKYDRVYIDLFAGPGVWQDPQGHRRLGSPLRALSISKERGNGRGFTEAYFVNQAPEDHEALGDRVDAMVEEGLTDLPRDKIHVIRGDANTEIPRILGRIHRAPWVFVFADPENPSQWPWSSVKALRAQGHRSIELYGLLPLQMALIRMASYSPEWHTEEALTRFFGSREAWQEAVKPVRTSSQYRAFAKRLEDAYAEQLRLVGWKHVDTRQRIVGSGKQARYHMVFATDHPAAVRLAEWEAEGDQFALPL